jgi:hypothetical protein
MADSLARAYSRTAMALGAGIMTPRADLKEQIRSTRLVSCVPKAPLYTLVGLNWVYAVIGVVPAMMALESRPEETKEVGEKLSTAGLLALCSEGVRAERVVRRKRDIFAEFAGVAIASASARVAVQESRAPGGGHVFRLRDISKEIP